MSKAEAAFEVVFKEELDLIKSEYLRKFVKKCFINLTPDYFWEIAASSSGKYHPKIVNKKHGLIVHTKLCVWWGKQIAESFERVEIDVIVAALLLHDLQKFGKVVIEGKPTLANHTSVHGPMLATQIEKLCNNVVDSGYISIIIASIALHMGKWTDSSLAFKWRQEYGDNNNVKVVQLADYIASRKFEDVYEKLDKWEFSGEVM